MFVNVTHPSQIRDKKVQRKVKAFTSIQNQRRRKEHQTQDPPNGSRKCARPPPFSEDENNDKSSGLGGKDLSSPSIRVRQHKHHPVSSFPRSDLKEDLDVEEIGYSPQLTWHSLVLFTEQKAKDLVEQEPEEILELYPSVGNITLPFSETGLSPQTAARLRRLTQFYIEVDGPTSIWRPQQLVESCKAHVFKRNFFAMSMTEPVIMEAVFAGSQLRLDLGSDPNNKPSALVLQHRGKVMKMIEERITNPKKMLDDVTFFAIMGMITLDAFLGNWASFKSNLDGFRMLVVLRGGIENLGWQGWFQTHLGWTEFQWATQKAKNKPNMRMAPAYPRHPFPVALSNSVSKLPEGLIEAALLRNLSIEVLNLLHEVNSWTTSYDDDKPGIYYVEGLKLISNAAELMGNYEISRSERIFCIATLAYIIETDGRSEETRTPRGLEDYLLGIQRLHSGLSLDDALLWAAVVIAASNDNPQVPSINKWRILDSITDSDVDGKLGNWEDVKKRMRQFFWNESVEKTWEVCWKVALDRRKKRASSKEKGRKLSMTWVHPPVYDVDQKRTPRSTPKST